MADPNAAASGLGLTLSSLVPIGIVTTVGFILKGRSIFAAIWRGWTAAAEKERQKLDDNKDALYAARGVELKECQAKLEKAEALIEKLRERVAQLRDSISWWRDYSGNLRGDYVAFLRLSRFYEESHDLKPLEQNEPPPVPRAAELDQTADGAD